MSKPSGKAAEDLPPDNAARIVLYDTMMDAVAEAPSDAEGLDVDTLFERAIPRLRVLVPRELHIEGERAYFTNKLDACVEAGILRRNPADRRLVLLDTAQPQIRYPDGTLLDYKAGLEAARERLEADDNRLRRGGFDIRHVVRSPVNDKKSERYRNLVESIRQVGFFDHYPIIENFSGSAVVDGLARQAAAAEVGVTLKTHHRKRLPRHLDGPLNQTLIVLHLNADRLSDEERDEVHSVVAERAGRSWFAIAEDLELTRDWRQAEPKQYDVKVDVKLIAYAGQTEPKIQMTTDGTRVMLRSVMQQAGLPEYRRDDLLSYVTWEFARTKYSGRKAHFVDVHEAIVGIERMQNDRAQRGRKIYSAWNDVRRWLIDTFEAIEDADPPAGAGDGDGDERPEDASSVF